MVMLMLTRQGLLQLQLQTCRRARLARPRLLLLPLTAAAGGPRLLGGRPDAGARSARVGCR
jgi:hypothetical protein